MERRYTFVVVMILLFTGMSWWSANVNYKSTQAPVTLEVQRRELLKVIERLEEGSALSDGHEPVPSKAREPASEDFTRTDLVGENPSSGDLIIEPILVNEKR